MRFVIVVSVIYAVFAATGATAARFVLEPSLASPIIDSIRQIEQHRLILRLSRTRIESLRNTFEQLRTAKPRDARAIQKVSSQLALTMNQREKAEWLVAEFATRLDALKSTLPLRSVAEETLLASHLQGLHGLSLRRARVDHQISALERQLRALRSQPVRNAAAIQKRMEALSSMRVERHVVHAELEAGISDFKAFSSRVLSASIPDSLLTDSDGTDPVFLTRGDPYPVPPIGGGSTSPPDPAPSGSRSATLNWSIPTSRANGAPLLYHDLQGYVIRVTGDSIGEMTIAVNEPLTTTYVFNAPVNGTYTFAIAARDALGQLGAFSGAVSKAIL